MNVGPGEVSCLARALGVPAGDFLTQRRGAVVQEQASETCEFIWQTDQEGGVGRCDQPATFDVRWRNALPDGRPGEGEMGSMCLVHIAIACDQLDADPEVISDSIQLRRTGEVS